MVPGAERLLLYYGGPRLCDETFDYSFASTHHHSATDTIPNAAAYTSTDSTCKTLGASRPIQLRCRCREHVGSGQERVVLPYSPSRLPTDCAPTATHHAPTAAHRHAHRDLAAEASRPLQLQ